MKALIVTLWISVASSSAGSISDKRGIGISSGYGGAYENYGDHILYGYTGGYGGVKAYSPIPNGVRLNEGIKSTVAISSGYGGAFSYTSIPKVVNDNKNSTVNLTVLSGKGEVDRNSSISKTDDINTELHSGVPVSSSYSRADSNGPLSSVVMQSSVAFSSAYDGAYANPAISNIVNENRDLQLGIPISIYGGFYGYAPLPRVSDSKNLKSTIAFSSTRSETNDDSSTSNTVSPYRDLSSGVPVSSGYGGAYGYALTPSIDITSDVIKSQNVQQITQVVKELKMESMVDLPIYSTGFSGYGSGISSYSGYSRPPGNPGYGFAYASGWL